MGSDPDQSLLNFDLQKAQVAHLEKDFVTLKAEIETLKKKLAEETERFVASLFENFFAEIVSH